MAARCVSFWIPIDPVGQATLRLIAGSHRWKQLILPVRWLDQADFYSAAGDYRPVPDPDREPGHRVLEWTMQPGDAVLFHFRTAHGARGNPASRRRRVLSLRWVGDDAHYAERSGSNIAAVSGAWNEPPDSACAADWFPVIYDARRVGIDR